LGCSQPGAPKKQGARKTGTTKINFKDELPYVWIQPGAFTMGCSQGDVECDDDETPHRVTITKGFWIGQTEVTQAAYERVAGSHRSGFRGVSLPVERIDWEQAASYCKAVGMRLPTEAEWEYAARGGNASARYGALDRIAWSYSGTYDKTHDVGTKQANGYGLYDMLGNVFEWVADWYGDYGSSPVTDPKGPSSGKGRGLRGGSYLYGPGYARASGRNGNAPIASTTDLGVRCAGASLPEVPPPPPPPPPPGR
jgi:formylglycine-generating enzyme required for sulfatase activity